MMTRTGRTLRAAALLAAAWAAPAASDDGAPPPVWRLVPWGADAAALEAAGARRLPGGFDYGGGLRAEHEADARIGGLRFRALFQRDGDGRLRQILLERRRPAARPADFAAVLDALRRRLGPPTRECRAAARGGRPLRIEMIWDRPDATVHALFLDFSTTALVDRRSADMRRMFPRDGAPPDRDPFRPVSPAPGENGVDLQALPRRLLVRAHDPAAAALSSPECGPARDPAAD